MLADTFNRLPTAGKVTGRPAVAQDAAQRVVKRNLVIQVVKASVKDIAAVECHVINLGNKDDV